MPRTKPTQKPPYVGLGEGKGGCLVKTKPRPLETRNKALKTFGGIVTRP